MMANKKQREANLKKSTTAPVSLNDKVDRYGKLLAAASTSPQFAALNRDPDMHLMVKATVAFTILGAKTFAKGEVNPETMMGECFLLGYLIGRNSIGESVDVPQESEDKHTDVDTVAGDSSSLPAGRLS